MTHVVAEPCFDCKYKPFNQKSGTAMSTFKSLSQIRFAHYLVALSLVLAAIAISPVSVVAQGGDSDLSKQLLQLQAQITRLEAALQHQPKAAASTTQQPTEEGNQSTEKKQATPGVPEGKQIKASLQNCVQCHQTRPAGLLPPTHLESLSGGGQGGTQAAGGQESSGAGMGQMAQGGQGMQGMDGGKEMGMMGGMMKDMMGGMMGGMGDKKKPAGGMGMDAMKMGGMGSGGASAGGGAAMATNKEDPMMKMMERMQMMKMMQMMQNMDGGMGGGGTMAGGGASMGGGAAAMGGSKGSMGGGTGMGASGAAAGGSGMSPNNEDPMMKMMERMQMMQMMQMMQKMQKSMDSNTDSGGGAAPMSGGAAPMGMM